MSIFVSFFFLGIFSFTLANDSEDSDGEKYAIQKDEKDKKDEKGEKDKKDEQDKQDGKEKKTKRVKKIKMEKKEQKKEEKQKERQERRVRLQEKIQQKIISKYQININRLGYFIKKITRISDLSEKIGYDNSTLINNVKDIEKIKSDMEDFLDQINQIDIDINNMRQQQISIRDNIKKTLTETKDEFKNLRIFLKNKRKGRK